MTAANVNVASCPLPLGQYDRIVLGHGGGGRLTADLVGRLFLPQFQNDVLSALEDQATLSVDGATRIALTTDAFVVKPIFFPGGDIGRLSICGTVNDLVVGGAIPRFVAAAFVLEEGLAVDDLRRIVASMREACEEARVTLVAGDTKVVERGKGDQVFITTTGVGFFDRGQRPLSVSAARPGDRVLVSGTLGDHGTAILSVREGIEFETQLTSDVAPLLDVARAVLDASPGLRCMRDPTRGGLATSLNEIATASRVAITIDEGTVPVRDEVRGACEMLGLDPLYVANEGKLVAVVPPEEADGALEAMRALRRGRYAAIIGTVTSERESLVKVRSATGGQRVLPMIAGEQLPRIC
jgi:hydrogenase expression/formation protein HypE